MCTKKVIFHLICEDGSILPVSMFYSKEATDTVISPTDIVFCNADKYDSWWQLSNCKQGTDELRFYKTNTITRVSIDIRMVKNCGTLHRIPLPLFTVPRYALLAKLSSTQLLDRLSITYGTTSSTIPVPLPPTTSTRLPMMCHL